jgi:phosphoribosylanthranilate isomerase
VDFIGFIFYPTSARAIVPEDAASIVQEVRRLMGAQSPRFVGVFVDAPVQDVGRIREQVGLDLVQLHGDETPDQIRRLQPGAFKALRPASLEEAQALAAVHGAAVPGDAITPQLLVDAYHPTEKGGTGQLVDFKISAWLSRRYRLLLAGGLNPNNIAEVVKAVQPWGVDVSSGVEIVRDGRLVKGRKDPQKVQAFITAVCRVSCLS